MNRSSVCGLLRVCAAALAVVINATPGRAQIGDDQVVNPATQAKPDEKPAQQKPEERVHTYDMPPVDVFGKAPLREDDRIGDYQQPRWTADRLFSETRVYVIPKGKVEFEYWFKPVTDRDGNTETSTMYEVEFGLPGRIQLDFYLVGNKENIDGPFAINEQKAELRWAFADWGKIWGNPTIYLEWTTVDGSHDLFEGKLLFGGNITSGWHWGSNLVWEHELGGPQENSNEWTLGFSHTVKDSKIDVGVETQLAFVNAIEANGKRGDFTKEFLVGPSFQFRPLPQMHIDVAPLFGTTHDASRSKIFVVLGYEF